MKEKCVHFELSSGREARWRERERLCGCASRRRTPLRKELHTSCFNNQSFLFSFPNYSCMSVDHHDNAAPARDVNCFFLPLSPYIYFTVRRDRELWGGVGGSKYFTLTTIIYFIFSIRFYFVCLTLSIPRFLSFSAWQTMMPIEIIALL